MALLLAMTAIACGAPAAGPPEIVVDRSTCSHCGMLISEPRYAAAYRTPEGEARVFDDIGCMRAAVKGKTAGVRFWFHDAGTGEWIDPANATFVSSQDIQTPMGGGVIAYRDPEAARAAAAKHRGKIVKSLEELLAMEEGS